MTPVETRVHTRLLRFSLGEEESAAYWRALREGLTVTKESAFTDYIFGQRSESSVITTMWNMDARYGAFPTALQTLTQLELTPAERVLVCNLHVQLSDPMYRRFTGWLAERRSLGTAPPTRDEIMRWAEQQQPMRWGGKTKTNWSNRLLATATSAGLLQGSKEPRRFAVPHVTDTVLTYILHLLRTVQLDGTVLDNIYLRSLGLSGGLLTDRVRSLPHVTLERMGDLIDLRFDHPDLLAWARSRS